MGNKIRNAMGERDAYYTLVGLIEVDDMYFGAPRSGTRSGGAAAETSLIRPL
jgi:hypothetical protein